MRAGLEISLLGGFAVSWDGRLLHGFESDKARALLAYLTAEHERPQRREKLAGLLWPDLPEKRARRNLSQTLYSLRQVFGEKGPGAPGPFLATPHDICFNALDGTRLDLAAFRAGVLGCERHAPGPSTACGDCLAHQDAAVGLYQGELLAGFSLPGCPAFEEWLLVERERIHRTALSTLAALAAAHRRRGDYEQALTHAQRAAALDPLWEPAQREVMHTLWLAGRRTEALDQYATCRLRLADELGIEPDALTQKLARRIQSDSEIVSPRSAARHNLPFPLTPFIGREREVALVQACLEDPGCRLLTLLGPGGCGKSRLAVEAARPLVADFPDGLFLLSLSGLGAGAALLPALAEILGLPLLPDREPQSQLLDFLRAKQLLLILDSCEALPEAAPLAVSILHQAPRVQILATSRTRLNVKGETLHLLGGLALPIADPNSVDLQSAAARPSAAVRLFLSAAQRVQPGYAPDDAELAGIARICHLVQGLPLGIILATAWLKLLPPTAIAAAMAENLGFLAVEWPDLPERQRSLRNTLEYTWRLLPIQRQASLRALSIFRGGFNAEAAARVAGASQQDLLAFLNQSLIQRTAGERYGVHDLMRQFVAEKLAEDPDGLRETGRSHGHYYLEMAAAWVGALQSGEQQATLEKMETESRNLAAAWAWAVAQGAAADLDRALEGVCLFYEMRSRHQEGEEACAAAAEVEPAGCNGSEMQLFLIRVQAWQARFARLLVDKHGAEPLLAACQRRIASATPTAPGLDPIRAFLFLELGDSHLHSDRHAAYQWYEKSACLFAEADERWWTAKACAGQGEACHLLGRFPEAISFYQQSLTHSIALGDPRGTAACHIGLGNNCFRLGRLEEGGKHLRAAIAIFDVLGDEGARATGQFNLARFSWWMGHFNQGFELVQQALHGFRNLGMYHSMGFAIVGRGFFATHIGEYERARSLAERAVVETKDLGFPRWTAFAKFVLGGVLLAKGHCDDAYALQLQAIETFGEIDQLEDLASALALASAAALQNGNVDQGRAWLEKALALCLETRGLWALMHALPAAVLYVACCGEAERAIELRGLACRYPQIANSRFFSDLIGPPVDELAQALPPAAAAAARERGTGLDLWATVGELRQTLYPPA